MHHDLSRSIKSQVSWRRVYWWWWWIWVRDTCAKHSPLKILMVCTLSGLASVKTNNPTLIPTFRSLSTATFSTLSTGPMFTASGTSNLAAFSSTPRSLDHPNGLAVQLVPTRKVKRKPQNWKQQQRFQRVRYSHRTWYILAVLDESGPFIYKRRQESS